MSIPSEVELGDLSKGVADLAAGAMPAQAPVHPTLGASFFSGNQAYDYSHLLSPEVRKAGHRLYIDHSDYGQISAHIFNGNSYVGGVDGHMNGDDLHVEGAQIMPLHRGKGLGTPLYEAVIAHSAKHFNAARWVGGDHSTSAHKLHERLTTKHGLQYEGGAPNSNAQSSQVGDFDKKFGSYSIHLKSEIEAAEEALAKVLPTPTFPKIGLPDNRRETQLINTPRQQKIADGVLNNAIHMVAPSHPKIQMEGKAVGRTFGNGVTTLSFARGSEMGGRPGEVGPRGTMLHEDLHRVFTRVADKYGEEGRMKLGSALLNRISPSLKSRVMLHTHAAPKGYEAEEAMAHMLNYLNDPNARQKFHMTRKDSPEIAAAHHSHIKRAYKTISRLAGTVDESWFK